MLDFGCQGSKQMRRRLSLLLPLIILAGNAAANAQKLENDGLVLFANIQSAKTIEGCDSYVYEIQLRLQFRNDGVKPLIVLDPRNFNDWIVSRKIEFLYRGLGDDSHAPDETEKIVATFRTPIKEPNAYVDPLSALAASLDKTEPPRSGTVIIQPGFVYESFDNFRLEQKFRLEGPKGNEKKVWQGSANQGANDPEMSISEMPAFTVEYNVTLPRYLNNPKLFYTLQRRWEPFGKLVLDDKSNFTVKTERIVSASGMHLRQLCAASSNK